jgi:hypothetical protein
VLKAIYRAQHTRIHTGCEGVCWCCDHNMKHSAALSAIRTGIADNQGLKECRTTTGIWKNTESVSGSEDNESGDNPTVQ